MSVFLYEGAMRDLLDSELGVVGRFVRIKTIDIKDKVAGRAGDYYDSAPGLGERIAADVDMEMVGSTGVVTINPSGTGHKWARLIEMANDGRWQNRPQTILEQSRF